MASAPPTNLRDEASDFLLQVNALVNQHLTEDGKLIFPQLAASYGYLLLAILLAKANGVEKQAFLAEIPNAWNEAERGFEISDVRPQP